MRLIPPESAFCPVLSFYQNTFTYFEPWFDEQADIFPAKEDVKKGTSKYYF